MGDTDIEVEVIKLSAELANLHEMQECDGLVCRAESISIRNCMMDRRTTTKLLPKVGRQSATCLSRQCCNWPGSVGLPVLGVCRGLQLINVTCGGSLVQDLGADGDATHENTSGVDKQHPVKIVAASLLAGSRGQDGGVTNSAHHQAIDQLGEGLMINCHAADGTIEGIEWADPKGRPFLLAVQWHPERMFVNGLADAGLYQALRDRFIEEVKKFAE